ncbi:VOC family protein [Actinoplanes sp. NPDC026670]|uniref:VOC family protein n=1 Tax=Actinoplanes sp. NPDC026670 TaxID=3154700 RepID=UPI0033EF0794
MRLDHVGLTVGDIDKMSEWYQGALGLTSEFSFELAEHHFRGVMLRGDGYRIELLERAGSTGRPSPANPIEAALTRGFGHIALDVTDVDSAYQRLIEAGATDRMSPRPSPEPGVRMAYVADPEGNLIELLDRQVNA